LEERVEKRTAELKVANQSLRDLSVHLQSIREEERTKIARDIHDELGQTLTALKMELSWLAGKLPADQEAISEKVQNMINHIDMTIDSVQRIYTELRPTVLDNLGLVAAIEWQAKEFQERTGIKCEVSFNPENIIMDRDERTAVFRIFQEAMTNIARHAEASAVTIDLEETSDRVILTVKDNGKGITEEQILDPRAFGIIGMKERAYFLGGEVKISGIVNKGTAVILNIPATH
jgi:signal transduction histidine kinase